MDILVVGLNHRHAPVELRERLAFPTEALAEAVSAVEAPEAVILSTCNRVEIYAAAEKDPVSDDALVRFLAGRGGVDVEAVAPHVYRHRGADTVRHLFRVAAGLDAMVVGEAQILGQVKDAYHAAQTAGRTGKLLNPLFQHAFYAAKRARTETAIGERNVSVPSVAAALAERIFSDLGGKTALVLGAGETAELTLEALRDRGLRKVIVVNRTPERAKKLVDRFGGEAHGLSDLLTVLPRADILVACATTKDFLLGLKEFSESMRARRNSPVFVLDISVPRNVDPEINRLDRVYLYNIDHLESIVTQNLRERRTEAERCEPIIEEEAATFMGEIATVDVAGLVQELRKQVETIGGDELERALSRLENIPEGQKEEIKALVHRLVNKFLHQPLTALRKEATNSKGRNLSKTVRRLFGIGQPPEPQ